MILAHFIGKKKWQMDARGRRRVGLPGREHLCAGAHSRQCGGASPCCQTNPRAATPARLDRVRRARTRRLRGLHRRRLLIPCHVFSKCAASLVLENRALTTRSCRRHDGRIGPRRSVVERRRGCFEMSGRRRELPAAATIERRTHAACIDRGRSRVSRQRRHGACVLRAHKFPAEAPGCGTGLIHCGGQTGRRFAAEMR